MNSSLSIPRHLVLVAAVASSVWGAPALAEESVAEDGPRKAEARARLDAGNELLRERQYEGALREYQAAFRAYPSPKIRLNIAEAHFQLGNWAGAYDNYQGFLTETEPDSELHAAASARRSELESKVAFIQIESPMDGVAVFVSDVHAGDTPVERVAVNPGRHTVVAEKDGYQSFEISEILTSGETKTVVVAMVPIQVAPPVAIETRTDTKDDGSVFEEWWFWAIVGGVVVVGAGVAVAASTGGSDFLPAGELGASGTSSWERF